MIKLSFFFRVLREINQIRCTGFDLIVSVPCTTRFVGPDQPMRQYQTFYLGVTSCRWLLNLLYHWVSFPSHDNDFLLSSLPLIRLFSPDDDFRLEWKTNLRLLIQKGTKVLGQGLDLW